MLTIKGAILFKSLPAFFVAGRIHPAIITKLTINPPALFVKLKSIPKIFHIFAFCIDLPIHCEAPVPAFASFLRSNALRSEVSFARH
jgi:hypothetical protein